MTVTESDISWQLLRQIVQSWAGSSADVAQVMPLYGGCINTTLKLTLTDGRNAVLKISPHRINQTYRDEAHQLQLLRKLEIPVPDVYDCVTATLDFPHSYLLMEFVTGSDWAKCRSHCTLEQADHLQHELAEHVARMHGETGPAFGRVAAAGASPADSWAAFYRDLYDPIVTAIKTSPLLPIKTRKRLARLHDHLDQYLAHGDAPRLVHWDLWSGNLLAHPNGDGHWHLAAVLDPNCKFAHAEAELAYLELFHTTTPAFLKYYQHHHKLPPEYHRLRKHVYQLYELMNHVQLFGHEYVKPMQETLDHLPV